MIAHVEIYVWSYCPSCQRAEGLLEEKGIDYERHVMDDDEKGLAELKNRTGCDTVPQIFINDEFIGGCEDLYDLDEKGELDSILGIEEEDFDFDDEEE